MGATIQSLERGLVILDILAKAGKPLSLNEISVHFSIDRSSVFRLVSTLLKCGYVIQHSVTKQYSLGYKVLELSGALTSQSHIDDLIKPLMRRILEATHQNTHLAALDGDQVVFLAVEQPKDHLALNITVGSREPSVVTALGKSLLAFQDEENLDRILEQYEFIKYTERSIRSVSQLKKNLQQVKKELVAVDDEEYRTGIVCIAAPVFDHNKKVRYSIGITGLRDIVKPYQKEYQEIVKQAGIEASRLF
ncbi:IclR family transcriptional regulator [bacterium]|nr:IclR family transcriptional regulator [bacterium]